MYLPVGCRPATCQILIKRILKPGQYRSVNLDRVPQVLQTKVFVGAMLVIVVIGYRQNQDRCVQGVLDNIQGQTPTHGRCLDKGVVGQLIKQL